MGRYINREKKRIAVEIVHGLVLSWDVRLYETLYTALPSFPPGIELKLVKDTLYDWYGGEQDGYGCQR